MRESTWHPLSADFEGLDLRTAACLALPSRCDTPVCLAFCGVAPDAFYQSKQFVDVDAIDDSWDSMRNNRI